MLQVCERLGIIEVDYFGLQYTGSKGESLWLNLRNRISQQVDNVSLCRLKLRVKFFVEPHLILQDQTRWSWISVQYIRFYDQAVCLSTSPLPYLHVSFACQYEVCTSSRFGIVSENVGWMFYYHGLKWRLMGTLLSDNWNIVNNLVSQFLDHN